jgi:uncharacterized protein
MIVYRSTKTGFLNDAFGDDIEAVVLAAYQARVGHRVSTAEVRAWKESLLAMAKVLRHESIPNDCGVAVEYVIPQTAKRIDLLLSGIDESNRSNLIIVELKQWETATLTGKDGLVRTRFAGGESETSHPSYQAWSYAELLRNFNEEVYSREVPLQPCAYLHNFVDGGVLNDPCYRPYVEKAPIFLAGPSERERLRTFIASHVRRGDRGNLIVEIENGRIRPSLRLIDALTGMLQGKREFVLIDDQKVAYETIGAEARGAAEGVESAKRVIIVDGGPGTGKSVVAINLLASLTAERLMTKYVTKNRAPRAVFEQMLTGSYRRSRIASLFAGSGEFIETPADTFDALLVDEAHRLNEKSGLYANLGNNQIDEIIRAARCAVFFIDEDQRVTWKDIGRKSEIEAWARKAGAAVTYLTLASQFRCAGSEGYLAWLDQVLGIRDTANPVLEPDDFEFRMFDSPNEVRRLIEEKNRVNNRARMVAGYCWDWKSKKQPSVFDVVIPQHDFAMQWNLAQDGGLWITAESSVEQIGCIHTCQGLEVDYIGVIVGPDLIVRDGAVLTRPEKRSRQDQSIKGYKKALTENPEEARRKADAIIKNTYRTLMTRGMKGCYVYCTDPETARYFRGRIAFSSQQVASESESRMVADRSKDRS